MSVHQTRAHFLAKEGTIVDNPKVGPALAEAYWRPGNSEQFLDLVAGLTGKPLDAEAWVGVLKTPLDELVKSERADYDAAVAAAAAGAGAAAAGGSGGGGGGGDDVALNMQLKIIDGDTVIADSAAEGGFLQACQRFAAYVQDRFHKGEEKQ